MKLIVDQAKAASIKITSQLNKRVYYAMGAGIAMITGVFIYHSNTADNAFEVKVDGEVVGIVKTMEEIEEIAAHTVMAIEAEVVKEVALNKAITVTPINSSRSELTDKNLIAEHLKQQMTYDIKAVEVLINNEVVAVVESRQMVEDILEEIALNQLPEGSSLKIIASDLVDKPEPVVQEAERENTEALEDEVIEQEILIASPGKIDEGATVITVGEVTRKEDEVEEHVSRDYTYFGFYEDVVVRSAYVSEESILTPEEAKAILLSDTEDVVTYTMKSGDNIWDLAVEYGTTMDRILEINPKIEDAMRMQIGDVIKISAPDPILSIMTTEVAVFKEIIEADIEYIADDTMYEKEEKITQQGEDGMKELTVSVDKVNGKEVNREHIQEIVLKEPVTKIITYGTKERPKEAAVVTPQKGGTFMNPLNGKGSISSHYGSRWGGFHRGIDLAAPRGTPIYAAASGTVVYSGFNGGGYGNLVMIDHGNGFETYYAHNASNTVKVGQTVSKGQKVGEVGSTGQSTGNHLHFEIRINGNPVNPYSYIY